MDSATIRASSSSLSSSSSSFFSLLPNPNPSPNPGLFSLRFPGGDLPVFKSIRCIQSPPPDSAPSSQSPLKPNSRSPGFSFSCSAVSFSPSRTSELASCKLGRLISEFRTLEEPVDRVKRLLHYASVLPPLEESARVAGNRVMGCTAQVWLEVKMDGEGRMRFAADSDSEITKGFCSCLIWVLDGAAPEEVLALKTDDLAALNVGLPGAGHSRVNTWHNVLIGMHKRTKALVAERAGKPRADPFPSLVINADGIHAKGSYAEAQARFLFPEELKVKELVNVLKEKKIGVAAHFYMDPEVQGVLTAAQKEWPHIYISDSLIMADMAVKMAKAGCQFIAVLGVDFMAENVRAILDQAGFERYPVGVYRMSNERIGCSLADAAATPAYMNYLEAASASPPALHVVYINTSLETKAYAHELVPTITCTSSNVVQTILQELLQQMTTMTDEEIAVIHPQHNIDSIKSLLSRLHYYQDGTCIVHHLFGHEVVEKINEMYCDAFLTAHLEVPGEMFSLAMEAKRRGTGVVGSTQNILDFIKQRVQESLDKNRMTTSISVRTLLGSAKSSSGSADVTVEIVFPVSSESLTKTSSNSYLGRNSVEMGGFILPVIPGVASGEGCSIHGGCASCPYMKMNSLSSLLKVCHHLPHEKEVLSDYEAGRFHSQTPNGNSIADVGCEPILNMRHFQATKELPEKLVSQILHSYSNGRSTSIS
ncbi:hypothetical protein AAG906_026835 [Vitis piasezkii]